MSSESLPFKSWAHLFRVIVFIAVGAQPGACLHLLADSLQSHPIPAGQKIQTPSKGMDGSMDTGKETWVELTHIQSKS